jgi:hypothetical protein
MFLSTTTSLMNELKQQIKQLESFSPIPSYLSYYLLIRLDAEFDHDLNKLFKDFLMSKTETGFHIVLNRFLMSVSKRKEKTHLTSYFSKISPRAKEKWEAVLKNTEIWDIYGESLKARNLVAHNHEHDSTGEIKELGFVEIERYLEASLYILNNINTILNTVDSPE